MALSPDDIGLILEKKTGNNFDHKKMVIVTNNTRGEIINIEDIWGKGKYEIVGWGKEEKYHKKK